MKDIEFKRKLKSFYEKEGESSSSKIFFADKVDSIALKLSNVSQLDIVLDVGCGDGNLLRRVEDNIIAVGVEFSSVRARRAKEKGLEIIISDTEQLPFKDGAFTICFAIEVLEHVSAPKKMIHELDRVSSQRARVIVVTPNDKNWFIYRVLAGNISDAFHSYGHLHDFSQLYKIQRSR